jgi:hypothetical protein
MTVLQTFFNSLRSRRIVRAIWMPILIGSLLIGASIPSKYRSTPNRLPQIVQPRPSPYSKELSRPRAGGAGKTHRYTKRGSVVHEWVSHRIARIHATSSDDSTSWLTVLRYHFRSSSRSSRCRQSKAQILRASTARDYLRHWASAGTSSPCAVTQTPRTVSGGIRVFWQLRSS